MIELLRIAEKGYDAIAQSTLAVGEVAPDFTLDTQDGQSVRLYDLRGVATILIFYPADDTPGCTEQLLAFDAVRERVAAGGGAIFGVNDGDAASHRGFKAKLGVGFDLLVDRDGRVAQRFQTRAPVVHHVRRTVYGITPGGRVAFAERGMPDPERVVRSLGLWAPIEPPVDEGVPVDSLIGIGEPSNDGEAKKAPTAEKKQKPASKGKSKSKTPPNDES